MMMMTSSSSSSTEASCCFCFQNNSSSSSSAGSVVVRITSKHSAHENCLKYSSGLKQLRRRRSTQEVDQFQIERELRRGRLIPCVVCNRLGATVNCGFHGCHRTYHFPCLPNSSSIASAAVAAATATTAATSPKTGAASKNPSNKLHIYCPIHENEMVAHKGLIQSSLDDDKDSGLGSDSTTPPLLSRETSTDLNHHLRAVSRSLEDDIKPYAAGRQFKGPSSSSSSSSHIGALSQMKSMFCKEIDPHLKRLTAKKRGLDRSPLSVTQQQTGDDVVESSSPLTRRRSLGKENASKGLPLEEAAAKVVVKKKEKKKKVLNGRRSLTFNKTEKKQLRQILTSPKSKRSPSIVAKKKRSLRRGDVDLPLPRVVKRKENISKAPRTAQNPSLPSAAAAADQASTPPPPPSISKSSSEAIPKKKINRKELQPLVQNISDNNKAERSQKKKNKNNKKRGFTHIKVRSKKKISLPSSSSPAPPPSPVQPAHKIRNKSAEVQAKYKAFRKTPIKFDPHNIERPDSDVIPSPQHTQLTTNSKSTKKSLKKTVVKKLALEQPVANAPPATAVASSSSSSSSSSSTTTDPDQNKKNIIPGDYFSHGRAYYHVRTSSIIQHQEPEAEEDYQWIPDYMKRQIDEFLDLNSGEKEFFKLWNEYIILNPVYGEAMLVDRLEEFIDSCGERIARSNLYRNFILHLTNLIEHGILDCPTFLALVQRQQRIMAAMTDKPWFEYWTKKPESLQEEEGKPKEKEAVFPELTDEEIWESIKNNNHKKLKKGNGKTQEEKSNDHNNKNLKTKKKSNNHVSNNKVEGVGRRRTRTSLTATNSTSTARSNCVIVKFWGAGDYGTIADALTRPSPIDKCTYTYSPIRLTSSSLKRKSDRMSQEDGSLCGIGGAKRRRIIKSPLFLDL